MAATSTYCSLLTGMVEVSPSFETLSIEDASHKAISDTYSVVGFYM